MTSGYYARLRESREDDEFLAACIDRVVKQLEDQKVKVLSQEACGRHD